VSEVEELSKSSDLVSLTREELGLILEAQDIIPLSLRKKENQVFISLVDEYITNSWNWLKLDKLFLFFAGILSVILIITGVFFSRRRKYSFILCLRCIFCILLRGFRSCTNLLFYKKERI